MKHTITRTLALSILLAATGTSCSINVQHAPLKSPAVARSGSVTTAPSASGIDGRVGWGTFTCFFIPIVPVHVEGDGNAAVMAAVRDSLKKAGYDVRSGSPGPGGGKALTCKVESMSYFNYTYFFPLVPTWGGAEIKVALLSGDREVWTREFSGRGITLNFTNGYTIANRQAMTKVCNQMVDAFASDEFHAALTH